MGEEKTNRGVRRLPNLPAVEMTFSMNYKKTMVNGENDAATVCPDLKKREEDPKCLNDLGT